MRKLILAAIAVSVLASTSLLLHAQLGSILKGGAVVLLVKQFGKQINDGINTALMNRKWENRQATKVVPIVSIGSGAYVGAAQVIGDEEAVNKVEAVAQIELNLPGRARAKVLIPVDKVSLNVTEIQRVYDVGVSAVIDLKL
ncbi:MAG: hypothetical protein NZ805_06980 [Armatimonadetes bacterium]|nr:hypothetical protein [Armatimonadota bacterium]MDW8027510.1 hypothetical protein [Armatimonadota bacterium]